MLKIPSSCHTTAHLQVKLDVVHHKTMLDLHQRVARKDKVVGWFATGLGVSGSDALIQEFYSSKQSGCTIRNPVHMVVDTTLSVNDRLSIKTFVSRRLTLKETALATEFVEVPSSVLTSIAEGMGLDLLRNKKLDVIPKDTENFKASFGKLQQMIGEAHQYVEDVVSGKREGEVAIGRCARCLPAAWPGDPAV